MSRPVAVAVASIALVAFAAGCTSDDATPPTTAPTSTSAVPVTTAPPSLDAFALATTLASRDPIELDQLADLTTPRSPAALYLAHQASARRLLGAATPAEVRATGDDVEICQSPTDCVSIGALDLEPETGLLRSFEVGGVSIDGRVTGAGPIDTVEKVSVRVSSAARSSSGALTVILTADNSASVGIEWFGFAAVYVDPDGNAVEANGTWGATMIAAGESGDLLLAFPDRALGGVIEITGLRDDAIDLAATVVVPTAD